MAPTPLETCTAELRTVNLSAFDHSGAVWVHVGGRRNRYDLDAVAAAGKCLPGRLAPRKLAIVWTEHGGTFFLGGCPARLHALKMAHDTLG